MAQIYREGKTGAKYFLGALKTNEKLQQVLISTLNYSGFITIQDKMLY